MHAAIYHWKLREGVSESDFIDNWNKGTIYIHKHYGSYGATLHKAPDGTYYSYARWPNKEMWQKMMDDGRAGTKPYPNDPFVEKASDHITLEVIYDHLENPS